MAYPPAEPASSTVIDFPQGLVEAAHFAYAVDVQWSAPRRGLTSSGRDAVIRRLLGEAAAMGSAQVTPLRRTEGERQVIDEYAVRFIYSGSGIENVSFQAGDSIELERLRILALTDGKIVSETCIEQWTVLGHASA